MSEPSSRDLLEKIEAARAQVMDEARPEAVAKRRSQGLATARERIAGLVDAGSFREIGSLVEPDRDNELNRDLVAPADGAITGRGMLEGREACLVAHDYTVHGGSVGGAGDRKMRRLLYWAADRGLPLVMLLEGGGHRIQDGMNSAHFAAASPVFNDLARLSGWVPNVAAIMGQGFAGPTNFAALADFVVMIRGKSTMGMAGPALVKAGTGEEISKEDLGGAKRQADQQGIADLAVETEEECYAAIRNFLSYLPQNATQPPPIRSCDDPAERRDEILLDLVPADSRKVYDVRKVIEVIADRDSVFEIKPKYARNIVTCFARLAGRPVGFVANQPLRKGGILDSPASEKVAHFIAVCDAFGLPLVSLIDIPGFAIGSPAELSGLGRRSGRLMFEMGIATVPLVSIVLRKGYGGGYYAMAGGRAFDADAAFAWPTAEICAMSIEGAVDVAYKRDYQAAADPAAARQAMIERIKSQTGATLAARDFGID
ncbi:MAG: carboxyl transferase domain-containing protein, partial [Alphaproteobacteria bacterium]|nr:carboxyl transferase domain-containing protein [Alphaproteobacteria bacterium]